MNGIVELILIAKLKELESLTPRTKPINKEPVSSLPFNSILDKTINSGNKVGTTQGRTSFKGTFDHIIDEVSNKYNVASNLIKAVISVESNFNPTATSRSGAQGLMQLMPATARSLGVNNPFDPYENVEAGTKYLSQMLKKYNGDLSLALAAYNAGPGNVQKFGGIPPFQETQNYVRKVTALL